ncbi:D-alanine--D-alanine ligase family protein [Bacillaceae bacterium W0354]
MNIAVLYGGTSKERDVSLSSGKGIINALKNLGHNVTPIDFSPVNLKAIIDQISDCDIVFIGLHGKQGEDGTVQGLLELLNIPYIGSGVLASSLAMDKSKAKQIFAQYQLPIAFSKTYSSKKSKDNIINDINESFNLPVVVKPNQEGSTLGLSIVKEQGQLLEAIDLAMTHDTDILVEDYIKGRELTVAVIGKKGEEKALPIIEIVPKSEYYDYESKYTEGGSEHIVPAKISDDLTKQVQEYAVKAHQALGCETYSRVDFILTEKLQPIILEVNTLPGMTSTSLYPDAAKAIGLSYEDMINQFIELTLD